MDNNKVYKLVRIALTINNDEAREIFKLAGMEVSKNYCRVTAQSKHHPEYKKISDDQLELFLRGLSIFLREEEGEV